MQGGLKPVILEASKDPEKSFKSKCITRSSKKKVIQHELKKTEIYKLYAFIT